MARILAIDYGKRRVGLAVTDPMCIIATALDTIDTRQIFDYLTAYFASETVETIVIGEPMLLDGTRSGMSDTVDIFVGKLQILFPLIAIKRLDERFTSKIATQRMLTMGLNKTQRRDKGRIDRIAALIILEDYLYSEGIF